MMIKNFLVFFFLLSIPLCSFGQKNYKNYCNARFQFCIDYPKDFTAQSESDNGDGCVIISNDEKTEIRTYGSLENEEINNLTQELKFLNKESKITYKLIGKNYFIVSGINKDGKIFYRKTKLTKLNNYFNTGPAKVLQTLTITYPKSQADQYANYCKLIASSFTK